MSARSLHARACCVADLLRSCRDLGAAKQLHKRALDLQGRCDERDVIFLLNLVVRVYAKCGSLGEARLAFDSIPRANVFSYNALLACYAAADAVDEAWKIFHEMPQRNIVSWNTIILANARTGRLVHAKLLLEMVPLHDVVSTNAMIAGYAQEGKFREAKDLFDRAQGRDVVIWNALIHANAVCSAGTIEQVELFFSRCPFWDVVSLNEMLSAYAKHGHLDRMKRFFHEKMDQKDVFSWNTVIAALARVDHHAANTFFARMPQHSTVSWNSVVQGLVENDRFDDAKSIFESMKDRDSVSMIQMAIAHAQNGHLDQAKELFLTISSRTAGVWNALLWSYARHGHTAEALATFSKMPMVDRIACTVMIELHGRRGHLEAAESIFFELLPERDSVSCAAMMVAYSHNSCLHGALAIFRNIHHRADVMAWTAMVATYIHSGELEMATGIFREIALHGLRPDAATFVAILTGCSHLGLVSRGRDHFRSIESVFGMKPSTEHYCCMVDILGRARHLDEAEELVTTMPYLPDAVTWNTLLGACRIHGDVERGERVAKVVAELDERQQRPHLLLSNLYTSSSDAVPDEETRAALGQ